MKFPKAGPSISAKWTLRAYVRPVKLLFAAASLAVYNEALSNHQYRLVSLTCCKDTIDLINYKHSYRSNYFQQLKNKNLCNYKSVSVLPRFRQQAAVIVNSVGWRAGRILIEVHDLGDQVRLLEDRVVEQMTHGYVIRLQWYRSFTKYAAMQNRSGISFLPASAHPRELIHAMTVLH